jgi:hypothetical protein
VGHANRRLGNGNTNRDVGTSPKIRFKKREIVLCTLMMIVTVELRTAVFVHYLVAYDPMFWPY